jgi:hypothetical protein
MDSLREYIVIGAYGAYAFVVGSYMDLRARIDRLHRNHFAHLEERVKALEDRNKLRDDD